MLERNVQSALLAVSSVRSAFGQQQQQQYSGMQIHRCQAVVWYRCSIMLEKGGSSGLFVGGIASSIHISHGATTPLKA